MFAYAKQTKYFYFITKASEMCLFFLDLNSHDDHFFLLHFITTIF